MIGLEKVKKYIDDEVSKLSVYRSRSKWLLILDPQCWCERGSCWCSSIGLRRLRLSGWLASTLESCFRGRSPQGSRVKSSSAGVLQWEDRAASQQVLYTFIPSTLFQRRRWWCSECMCAKRLNGQQVQSFQIRQDVGIQAGKKQNRMEKNNSLTAFELKDNISQQLRGENLCFYIFLPWCIFK